MRPDARERLVMPVQREAACASLIPYSACIGPRILATYGNDLVGFIRLDGMETDHLGAGEIEHLFQRRNQLLVSTVRPDLAVHFLTVKRRCPGTGGQMPARTGGNFFDVLLSRHGEDVAGRRFVIEHYLVLIRSRPISLKLRMADFFTGLNPKRILSGDEADQDRETFEHLLDSVCVQFSDHKPRVLAIVPGPNPGQYIAEHLSLISYLVNHDGAPRPLGDTIELNRQIANARLTFTNSGTGSIGKHLFAAKAVKVFPQHLENGCLDDLLFLPCELVLSVSFRFQLQTQAVAQIERQIRVLTLSKDAAVSQVDELALARDEIASGNISIGESSFHLIHYAPDPDALENQSQAIDRLFDRAGLVPTDDDIALQNKYLATLPGNWGYRTRTYTGLHSGNIAALFTLRSQPPGRLAGHWCDRPLTTMLTRAHTAYGLDLHVEDLGNTIITGQSGSGKTVLICYLAACCVRAGARVVFIDKDRGAEIFVRAGAGPYHTIEPGTPTRFNPFAQTDTRENIEFTATLIQDIIRANTERLTPAQIEQIHDSVIHVFGLPRNERRLASLVHFLSRQSQSELYHALTPWIGEGQHAWLFDHNAPINITQHPISGFDMTHILDNRHLRSFALRWLIHQIDGLLDGSPLVIVIDEGWRTLDDTAFAAQIKNFAKTIRKRNGLIIFGSNNPMDLTRTEAGRELIVQSPTTIFTANPAGSAGDYDHYRLNERQIGQILALAPGSRELILVQRDHSAHLNFDLSACPALIKVLSGRTATLHEMHRLIKQHGPAASQWLGHFHPDLSGLTGSGPCG